MLGTEQSTDINFAVQSESNLYYGDILYAFSFDVFGTGQSTNL